MSGAVIAKVLSAGAGDIVRITTDRDSGESMPCPTPYRPSLLSGFRVCHAPSLEFLCGTPFDKKSITHDSDLCAYTLSSITDTVTAIKVKEGSQVSKAMEQKTTWPDCMFNCTRDIQVYEVFSNHIPSRHKSARPRRSVYDKINNQRLI
jgi:hypothetical protein